MSEPGIAAQPEAPKSATTLEQLKKMLDDFRSLTEEARKQSCIDRDYYDGHQLTDDERRVLRGRKQPEIIVPRVRRGVDGILGVVEQGKTDPRAYMRNPPEQTGGGQQPAQQAAGVPLPGQAVMGGNGGPPMGGAKEDLGDVASKTLRFIADTNHFQPLKMDVLENGLIEGSGAVIIEWNGQDVNLSQIRWEELVFDPRSRRADFKDGRYLGVAKWMYTDQAKGLTDDKEIQDKIDQACTEGGFFGWFKDRPNDALAWVDKKNKRLLVVELYYQEEGQWWRCVFTTNVIIEQAPSVYVDDKKQTVCPIEAQSCYVDRENRRYGVVRDMRGPQDGLNMAHSKRLHASNVRQVQPIDGNAPPVDVDTVRAEAARPDGVLPMGWKLADNNFVVAASDVAVQEFKGELERLGPNPATLGRQGENSSGRAVLARQQAGITELARPLGRFQDLELRIYRQMWNRARQFYTAPKWIRVTDDEGAPQYIQVNEFVGYQPGTDPQTGQPTQVPQYRNRLAEMDVDILVDAVPNTANLQQEVFSEVMELAKLNPQGFPPKVVFQLAPIPNKRKVLDAIEQAQQEQAAANAQTMELQVRKIMADIGKTESETEKNKATAAKTEVETVRSALEGHMAASGAMQPPPGSTGVPGSSPVN